MTNIFSEFHSNFSRLAFPLICAAMLCLGCSVSGLSQVEDILEDFTLVQNENTVVANFSIRGGASCNGVTLERRLPDDTVYEVAGAIQGVCGGSEFTEHYTLIDESPIASQENIYRLILGTQGSSSERSVIVIELISDYTIYPQPAAEEIFIKYNNPNNESVHLDVYDMGGRLIKSVDNLTNDIIYLNGEEFPSGMYIFQLQFVSSRMITGRFLRSKT